MINNQDETLCVQGLSHSEPLIDPHHQLIHQIPRRNNSMNKQQLSRLGSWPKNSIHRLWLSFPSTHKQQPVVTEGLLDPGDTSEETLLAGELSDGQRASLQVPKGFIAVYVGPELRRFVIPMACLSSPDFRGLMDRVAEEYGFEQEGALKIPCDEQDFEHILVRCLSNSKKKNKNKLRKSGLLIKAPFIN